MKTITEYCQAKVTEQYVTGVFGQSAFKAFQDINAAVANGEEYEEHELAAEHWRLSTRELASAIRFGASMLEKSINETLVFVKAGLIDAAIECQLDGDANTWDLSEMFERGAAINANTKT